MGPAVPRAPPEDCVEGGAYGLAVADTAQRSAAWLGRNWWTLQRFGLTPAKLPHRIFNRVEPRVFVDSVPKSGTHLLERALCLHPRLYRALVPTLHEGNVRQRGGLGQLVGRLRPGGILVAHLAYEPSLSAVLDGAAVRSVVMVRDPRDVAVSEAHFIPAQPEHFMHEEFRSVADTQARIRLVITGTGRLASLAERVPQHLGWRNVGALVVRFEDLVGPEGGGSLEAQLESLRRLYEHLTVEADEALVHRVRDGLFSGNSPTFRRGSIGQWKTAFDDETATLFKEHAGELLPLLGYRD
jgi:sulfotransferase 6B1